MLVTVTLNMLYGLTVTAKQLVEKPTLKCPECGGELTCLGFASRKLQKVGDTVCSHCCDTNWRNATNEVPFEFKMIVPFVLPWVE